MAETPSSFYLTKSQRNLYVRHMVNILLDKYLVSRPDLARAIGIRPNHLSDYSRGDVTISHPTMDRIETFINDLYEPLIREEIKISSMFIEELIKNSKKEAEGTFISLHESGIRDNYLGV